ncbi:MAG: DUF1453 domain-containing protein [Thermomonas sp.]
MQPAVMTWAVAAPLLAFIVYRRVRRNFGRQLLRPGRLAARSLFLAIVAGFLLFGGLAGGGGVSLAGWGVLLGLAAGGVLGWAGVRMTGFETVDGKHWYIPHPGIGLALTALMLARLAYRFFAVRATAAAVTASDPSLLGNLQRSPLTLAIAGLLLGYYLVYNIGLLRMARRRDGEQVRVGAD